MTIIFRKSSKIRFFSVITIFFVLGIAPIYAQDFPSKPVTIILPHGAGGIIDVGTRILSDRLSQALKVPVIIENKPGGGAGTIGITAFLDSEPNGYTILACAGGAIIGETQLFSPPAPDPRKNFLKLGYIADSPAAMSVAKDASFQSWEEFLKYAKANPGKLRGGVSSLGGETHVMFEGILKDAKIDSKMVPYPKTANLVPAILGGHLDWMCLSLPATLQYHKSGDVKIVLLTRRSSKLPDVPSGEDVGLPDVTISLWLGLFAHPKTPKFAYDKLVAAVEATAKDPEVISKLDKAGFDVQYKGPKEFSDLIEKQSDIFSNVLKEAKLKK